MGMIKRPEATITEAAILLRIPVLYDEGMSPDELYEATRGVWRVGSRRNDARLAMAVFDGTSREIYAIDSWQPAGTANYQSRRQADVLRPGPWESVRRIAPASLRSRYIDRSVASYFRHGNQNPVDYVNC